jgi:hypothetical protein
MKLRHALMMALMIVTVAGIAYAVAPDPSRTSSEGAATVSAAPAPADAAIDPYLNASSISSEAPKTAKSCQVYAYTCVFEGGPCGPVPNTCHCALGDTGWICGR